MAADDTEKVDGIRCCTKKENKRIYESQSCEKSFHSWPICVLRDQR